jgi:hypothetical protein
VSFKTPKVSKEQLDELRKMNDLSRPDVANRVKEVAIESNTTSADRK